ncbi:MAG: hypothetical protein QM487_16050 [Candidatus Marithrix sp.]
MKSFLILILVFSQSVSVFAIDCDYEHKSFDDYQDRGNRCEGFKNIIPLSGNMFDIKLIAAIVNRPITGSERIYNTNIFKLYLPKLFKIKDITAELIRDKGQIYIMNKFKSVWNTGTINRNTTWGTKYIKKIVSFDWSNLGVVAYLKERKKKILVAPILLESYSSSLTKIKNYTFIFKFKRGTDVKYDIYKNKEENIISNSDTAYRNKPLTITFESSKLGKEGFYTININNSFSVEFYHKLNY